MVFLSAAANTLPNLGVPPDATLAYSLERQAPSQDIAPNLFRRLTNDAFIVASFLSVVRHTLHFGTLDAG